LLDETKLSSNYIKLSKEIGFLIMDKNILWKEIMKKLQDTLHKIEIT